MHNIKPHGSGDTGTLLSQIFAPYNHPHHTETGHTLESTLKSEITKDPTSFSHGDHTHPTNALNDSAMTEDNIKYCTLTARDQQGDLSAGKEAVSLQEEGGIKEEEQSKELFS